MVSVRLLVVSILLTPAGLVKAQDLSEAQAVNAMRDMTRAQERQTDELRRLRQQADDQAVQEDRARRNAARDARSSRRFDRP